MPRIRTHTIFNPVHAAADNLVSAWLALREDVPTWVREELSRKGYQVETRRRTSGPITAIFFDREHGTMWGGASDFGEDYGIGW